ncbi:hypothetical protein EDI_092530 [Entamoeba dispar SAW760]|uniref:RRM domain-containing protein n=1 Tax=Entamoeba dispar (strain ATCC PRA-260 / SAW760) TaxID=370354 RepID=B0ED45_ENTDS|nr:uncharacterized protein EDI_092530 [Entamoeba dispar SAW760]EDR27462.1 hypothetical protein EDI_092530 [Entamoeba dispar SAW760]|eukprot:EDR27462.1 hypothetical protein EDI_092530 [Entamoeba dispar SAW760]
METTKLTHAMKIVFPEKVISQSIDGYGYNLYVHDETNSLTCYSLKTNTIIGHFALPLNTLKIRVAPTSHHIAAICDQVAHIYSLPTMQYIGSVDNLIDLVWSNDGFFKDQQFLVLCHDGLHCYQITSQKDNEILEHIAHKSLVGKHIFVNNSYSDACVCGEREIFTFSPSLSDTTQITKYPFKQKLTDACFCKKELFLLCGTILSSSDNTRKVSLPFRGSSFKLVSHFPSIIAYDANKIFIIEPEKLAVQSVIETKFLSIQQLETNTRLSLLTFVIPTTLGIGVICSDEYTAENAFLRVFELKSVKIHTKSSVQSYKLAQMSENSSRSKNSAPASDYSIFIGKTTGLVEREIAEVFQQNFGPVVKVRLHTGYGFVDFENAAAREKALLHQSIKVKNDKTVTISSAVPNNSGHRKN